MELNSASTTLPTNQIGGWQGMAVASYLMDPVVRPTPHEQTSAQDAIPRYFYRLFIRE